MKKAVLISCFNWYEKRLFFIRQELIKKGYDVVVLLSDYDHIKKNVLENRFLECEYVSVPFYKKNISLTRAKSHFAFGHSINERLEEIKPDFIYALVPPNNVGYYCSRYKKNNPKTKLIIDVIDLWPESMTIPLLKYNVLALLWKKLRQRALLSADRVVLECDYYKQVLSADLVDEKTSVLRLFSEFKCSDLIFADECQMTYRTQINNQKISFAYLGSLNSIIDYDAILAILNSLILLGFYVEFQIIGEGSERKRFIEKLKKIGVNVIYYGMIFDTSKKIQLLSHCDFAFNMMKNSVAVGLTMKSIDYFSIGLPIINTIKGDTWELVEAESIGFNFSGDIDDFVVFCKEVDINVLRKNVRKMFFKYFTVESFVNNVNVLLDSLDYEEVENV